MTQHVLFDLDGTLTDSAPGITRCLAHALRRAGGEPPAPDALRSFIGTPLRDIFAALLRDPAPEQIESAVHAYAEHFDAFGIRENTLYPGVREALHALRGAGCTLHVATAKRRDVALRVIELFELRPLFREVFGSEPAIGIVSKQEILSRGLEAAAIPRASATMVGDRHHDVDAARALGIRAIGVAWGYGDGAELSRAHAVAHTPSALPRAIFGHGT